jgi:cytochrome c peroxidase
MLSHFHQLLRQTKPLSRRAQIVRRPLAKLAVSYCALLIATVGYAVSAERPTTPQSGQAGGPPDYNPYPPGILPSDLDAEISRVRAEMRTIFGRYLAQAQALPPLTFSNTQGVGNPPIIQGSGYDAVRILGALLNYDENMSPLRNVACASCHMPYTGFSGPIPSVNLTMVAYPGTFHFRAGKRTAQRYTYAPQFPVLHFNETLQAFVGGEFWDARASNWRSP